MLEYQIDVVLFDLGGVLFDFGGVDAMRSLAAIEDDEELGRRCSPSYGAAVATCPGPRDRGR